MRTNKMAKKALKRLDRVDTLLSKVIDHVAKDEKEVRELLDSARTSVVRASVKAKSWVKAKSSIARKSLKEVKPATQKKNRPKAAQRKKAHASGKAKLQRKRILTPRTSYRSKAPRAAAVGSEAGTSPERDVSAI
jgi:hypothetical protein